MHERPLADVMPTTAKITLTLGVSMRVAPSTRPDVHSPSCRHRSPAWHADSAEEPNDREMEAMAHRAQDLVNKLYGGKRPLTLLPASQQPFTAPPGVPSGHKRRFGELGNWSKRGSPVSVADLDGISAGVPSSTRSRPHSPRPRQRWGEHRPATMPAAVRRPRFRRALVY